MSTDCSCRLVRCITTDLFGQRKSFNSEQTFVQISERLRPASSLAGTGRAVFGFPLLFPIFTPGCKSQFLRDGQHDSQWMLRRKLWQSAQLPREQCSRRIEVSPHCAKVGTRLSRKQLHLIGIEVHACTHKATKC